MEWDINPEQFEDENRTTALNRAMIKLIENEVEILQEMKTHLELNERHNFDMKMLYHTNRISQLAILAKVEDNPDYTDEEVEKVIQDAELHASELDYNSLFAMDDEEGGSPKRGLDVIDYIKKDDDPFGDF